MDRHIIILLAIIILVLSFGCEDDKSHQGNNIEQDRVWKIVVDSMFVTGSLTDIIRANAKFYAVGKTDTSSVGKPVVLSSPDGVKWQIDTVLQANNLLRIGYNGLDFIAIGSDNIYISPNGKDWMMQNPGVSGHLGQCTWGDNLWVVTTTGQDSPGILTSPNGIGWTPQKLDFQKGLIDVIWNGEMYIAVGREGQIFVSTDARNWSKKESGTIKNLNRIIWGGGKFIIVGREVIVASPDSSSWTVADSSGTYCLHDIAYGNNSFVAVGHEDSIACILYSETGYNWSRLPFSTNRRLHAIAYDGQKFVAVGEKGVILISQ